MDEMTEEKTSTVLFALGGLLACVGLAWVGLLATGGLDGDWLLAGALAFGLGVLAVNTIDRVAGVFTKTGFPDDVEAGAQPAPEISEVSNSDDETPRPRLWIMVAASLLEALALSLFIGYLLGSLVISVGAGLLLSVLAIAISLRVSQRFSEPA
jgi:hypothetical protein